MALETATYIDGLNASNPAASDAISTADDHLRLIKSTIKATFPNITGPVTATQAVLNAALQDTGDTMTGPLVVSTAGAAVTLQTPTTTDLDGVTLRFKNTDTSIALNQGYGGIEWESSDTSNNGVRGYIKGVSEGTTGQLGISIATQGSGASAPVEAVRVANNGNATFAQNVTVSGNLTVSGTVGISSGTITGITDIAVADGGTGRSTLTAKNLVVGNGTSAVNFIAPGTNGQVLTSNGTDWVAAAVPVNGLGVGQTWQDVNASRASGTTYTNNTGKPITVLVGGTAQSGSPTVTIVVGGVTIATNSFPYGTIPFTFIVPDSTTYSVTFGPGTGKQYWSELR